MSTSYKENLYKKDKGRDKKKKEHWQISKSGYMFLGYYRNSKYKALVPIPLP